MRVTLCDRHTFKHAHSHSPTHTEKITANPNILKLIDTF